MHKKQENTLSMLLGFVKHIDSNPEIVFLLPFFPELFAELKNAVAGIRSQRIIQQGDKSGATDEKNHLRKQVEAEAYQISKQLVALASLKHYDTLLKEVSYQPSDFVKAQDTVVSDIAALIVKHALANFTELTPFGTTQAKLDSLQAVLALYDGSLTKPKDSITARAQATKQIEALFEVAMEKLDLLTKIVDAVSDTYPALHAEFKDKIKVVSLGSKGMSLRANAVDSEGNPLPNVKVEIVSQQGVNARLESGNTSRPTPIAIKKTSTKGIFRIQNLADGSYTAIVKKLGFKEQLVDFHVVKGELVNLNFTLESA